jgi:hypothetical protein
LKQRGANHDADDGTFTAAQQGMSSRAMHMPGPALNLPTLTSDPIKRNRPVVRTGLKFGREEKAVGLNSLMPRGSCESS